MEFSQYEPLEVHKLTSMYHEITMFVIFNTQENVSCTICRHSSPLSEDQISQYMQLLKLKIHTGIHMVTM